MPQYHISTLYDKEFSGYGPWHCITLSLEITEKHFSIFFSLAGVSRSVTLVVAYIMTVTSLGWQEALAAVRVARPCASPNVGFENQLQEFETTQLQQVIHEYGVYECVNSP